MLQPPLSTLSEHNSTFTIKHSSIDHLTYSEAFTGQLKGIPLYSLPHSPDTSNVVSQTTRHHSVVQWVPIQENVKLLWICFVIHLWVAMLLQNYMNPKQLYAVHRHWKIQAGFGNNYENYTIMVETVCKWMYCKCSLKLKRTLQFLLKIQYSVHETLVVGWPRKIQYNIYCTVVVRWPSSQCTCCVVPIPWPSFESATEILLWYFLKWLRDDVDLN